MNIKYAKAYLFNMINVVLFTNKSNDEIQMLYITLLDQPRMCIREYSWEFGALGYIYKRVCLVSKKNVKEISVSLFLL